MKGAFFKRPLCKRLAHLSEGLPTMCHLIFVCITLRWNVQFQSLLLLYVVCLCQINTLRPRQNGRHFPNDSFKWILFIENASISIKMSLMFVSKGLINNIPALVQIMAWRRAGNKPLSEPMPVRLLTYICVTRPQWVKHFWSQGILRF